MRSRLYRSRSIVIASTVLNCILQYAANFFYKSLGPVVPNTQICHLLWTFPAFCAWTTVGHPIRLILLVLWTRNPDFTL